MTQFQASAPGKIILFGEHAVVYHRPAIAIPVFQLQATALIQERPANGHAGVWLDAPQINLQSWLADCPPKHPIAALLQLAAEKLSLTTYPDLTIQLSSTIPLASGMGSGAAISIAILRALIGYFNHPLPDAEINHLAYQIEKIYHGTPSGIDNTVITYQHPVYFVRGEPFQHLCLHQGFTFIIADTGIPSTTLEVVADVRRGWQEEPAIFEDLFNQVASIVNQARQILEGGPVEQLGPLMTANQVVLRKMGVSSPRLDYLIDAALFAGALGAKLSGGGRGGNLIALVKPDMAEEVAASLRLAGAKSTLIATEFPC